MSYDNAQEFNVFAGNDLKEIIENITDSSIMKPYVVKVNAGVYSIGDNSIAVPTYVTVEGAGSVIINCTGNTTKTAFTMATGSALQGLAIFNHLSTGYGVSVSATGSYVIDDLTFIDCTRGVAIGHATASATIRNITLIPNAATMSKGITVAAGDISIDGVTIAGSLEITAALEILGSDSNVHCRGFRSVVNSSVLTAVDVSDSANLAISEYDIHDATIGVSVFSQSTAILGNGSLFDCGHGIFADGAGTRVQGVGVQIEGSSTTTLKAGAGVIMTGTGIGNSQKMDIDPDAEMLISFLDTFPGDEAQALLGELHVGTPMRGRESCLGEGDSYVNGMAVYTYDGSFYTDVTEEASSASGSTFTYPNLSVNSAIYVGSDVLTRAGDYHKFYGIKFASTVAQVGGTVVAEYYNGSTWLEFSNMTTEANGAGNYYRKADQLFQVSPASYQVRFDPELRDDWAKTNDPGHTGNRFWIRFRITSALSTAPVFQQWKVHANRAEINADGFPEEMGDGRTIVTTSIPWSAMQDSASKLGNQDLYASDNCNAGFENNVCEPGDSIGTVFTLPSWVDTSGKMRVDVPLVPVATGTMEITAYINSKVDGENVYTSAPGSTVGEVSQTISKSVTAGLQSTFEFELDISDKGIEGAGIIPETVWLNIECVAGTFYGIVLDYGFLSWRRGSHV